MEDNKPAPPAWIRHLMDNLSDDEKGELVYHMQGGGNVPGKGTGDKVHIMAEPHEFVVSNDVMEKNPGLREHLEELHMQAGGEVPTNVFEEYSPFDNYQTGGEVDLTKPNRNFNPTDTPVIHTKEEYDAIPDGMAFQDSGDVGTKDEGAIYIKGSKRDEPKQ